MKLKSLELQAHPAVGNLQLSFLDGSGTEYSTVVLAGENGTGKTIILEAIQTALSGKLNQNIGTVVLEFKCDANDIANVGAALTKSTHPVLPGGVDTVTFRYDSNIPDWSAYELSWVDPGSGAVQARLAPMHDPVWRSAFRSFFNEAAVNFSPDQLSSITAMEVDTADAASVRSGSSLATQIAQLIVDIRAADAEELMAWAQSHPSQPVPETLVEPRFSRFRSAFDFMFPSKRFKDINRNANRIEIEFEEIGRTSTLSQLSTGEKQIVFRAGFLLRHRVSLNNSLILIDEPELSLHPEWQEKILGFYTHLLSDQSGNHPQIIVATHSPFIVHAAANAKVIILEKSQSTGAVSVMPDPTYPLVSDPASVIAFNIDGFIKAAKRPLLVLTEGQTDSEIIETAWKALNPGKRMPFELNAALGDRNISITLNDQDIFSKLGAKRAIVGVFDFDSAYNQWKGVWKGNSSIVVPAESDGLVKRHAAEKGWAMLLPVPAFRATWANQVLKGRSVLSIEFLFDDADIPSHMIEWHDAPLGHKVPSFKNAEKSNFASIVASFPPSKFGSFKPLFDRLDDILNSRI